MELKRSSGVLLHPSSLPGRFAVGDFGESAYRFVDVLVEAEQSWWQILPLTPPGYGGSPYGSTSSFSINLALVDPLWLEKKGWLTAKDVREYEKHEPKEGALLGIMNAKRALLNVAYARWKDQCHRTQTDALALVDAFYSENSWWLFDDALYSALKDEHHGAPWYKWEPELVRRDEKAVKAAASRLSEDISKYVFAQWVAHTQWLELREYAKSQGIEFIGDLPIFVAMDSFDVWAHRDVFQVGETGHYDVVAGVPPDYFSATGQKWGNPLYRWHDRFDTVMQWWIERIKRALDLVSLIRIDHFRAFADYWEVPAAAPTAESGCWRQGPGDRFFNVLREKLGDVPFIAEDLGLVSDEVYHLRDRHHLPGMKVLEFGFDGNPEHPFLPHTYPELCVAYPGTHDNNTIIGWMSEDASEKELHNARVYLSSSNEDLPYRMMESLEDSNARLVILQLQDIFLLPGSARMNTPGVAEGNWTWRMASWMIDPANSQARDKWEWLRKVTVEAERVTF